MRMAALALVMAALSFASAVTHIIARDNVPDPTPVALMGVTLIAVWSIHRKFQLKTLK